MSKGFERRTKTLLVEYKNQFKSNKFNDKRIGENDTSLSLEDKMFKRFVVERQKGRDKKSKKFNLNDNEEDEQRYGDELASNKIDLTHYGQSLSQIENFERVDLSDDDDQYDENDVDKGKISGKIVSENFFGGFDDSKKTDQEQLKKSRKQWIDEMIMKSKQLKYEKQKERDKTLDLTEQLDKEWRNILPLMGKIAHDAKQEQEKKERLETKKADDFDVLVKSLQFESQKAKPTDKLKKPEEIEKERLEESKRKERELHERMNKEVEEDDGQADEKKNRSKSKLKKIPTNHYSVDDMDFDDPEYFQMRNREEIKIKHKIDNAESEYQKDDDEEEEEVEEEEENETNVEISDEGEDDEEESEESEVSEKDDKADNDDSILRAKWANKLELLCFKLNNKEIDLIKFEKQLKLIIEGIDPSKDEKNKQRICLLTGYLIQYYQSLFSFKLNSNNNNNNNNNNTNKKSNTLLNASIDYKLVKLLTNHIYNLTNKYGNKSTRKEPSIYVEMFKKILKNLNSDYEKLKPNEKKFPSLGTLFTFKLISNVFPTSDFRHQITTPCLLMMTRYLTEVVLIKVKFFLIKFLNNESLILKCSVQTIGEAFRGMFLSNLCFEFVSKSKRYIPECVQFLNGILYLSVDWRNNKDHRALLEKHSYEFSTVYESFKRTNLRLILNKKVEKLDELSLINTSLKEVQQVNDSTIASVLGYSIDLLNAFVNLYEEMVSFREIFNLTNVLLNQLPVELYPSKIQEKIITVSETISLANDKPREYLKCMNKRPAISKLHEPKIVSKSKFDPRHHNAVISEKQLTQRKYKKELKSAIKEIRQDNRFLARVQLEEQLEKDAKRSQKVKEIMSSLASQEGDYQKIKRMKS